MSYIPKLNPTVGGGLPGVPERTGGDYAIGDIQYTEEALDHKWLPADGGIVLQTKYEKLFAKVGIQNPEGILGPRLPAPSVPIPDDGEGVDVTEDGRYIAVVHRGSPYLTVYRNDSNILNKIANPSPLSSGSNWGVAWNKGGTSLAVSQSASPYIDIYNRSGDTLTPLANPSVLPTSASEEFAWSPDGIYLAVVHASFPYITIYKRAGDSFTKLPDPTDLPPAFARSVSWTDDGVYLTVGSGSAPWLFTYKTVGDTFTKIATPLSTPVEAVNAVRWDANGIYLAVSASNSPYMYLYKRAGDVLTQLPAVAPGLDRGAAAFSWFETTLAIGTDTFLRMYERSGDTLALTLPNIVLGDNGVRGVSFSEDGKYLATAEQDIDNFGVNYVPTYYDVDTEFRLPHIEATVTPRIKVL